MLYPQSNPCRQMIDLSGFWDFRFDPADEGNSRQWGAGFEPAEIIAVPASWNDQFEDWRDYLGTAWYQTTFDLPWGWRDQRIFVRFNAVNYLSDVWLNGECLGQHEGGYLPFVFDVTGRVRETDNTLVVRVDGKLAPDRVPPGKLAGLPGAAFPNINYPDTTYDFFPYCGIQRPVLVYTQPRDAITDLTVTTDIQGTDGVVRVQIARTPGETLPVRVTLLFSNLAREAFRELRAAVAKMNAFLQERITGMRIIQLFATEAFQTRTFGRINHENYLAGMKQIRIFAVFMPIMDLFAAFAVALIIWYGGGKVIQETLSLGSLVAFISYIQMFFRPIRDISEKYNIMQSAMASTERIFEFMDHREEIPEPARPERPANQEGHVQFQGVSFAYRKDQPVLRDVSFEVNPGEMVAVVGATGAGKTTVVNLLERFYDRDQGMILLDGIDIRTYSKTDRESRGQCGYGEGRGV